MERLPIYTSIEQFSLKINKKLTSDILIEVSKHMLYQNFTAELITQNPHKHHC